MRGPFMENSEIASKINRNKAVRPKLDPELEGEAVFAKKPAESSNKKTVSPVNLPAPEQVAEALNPLRKRVSREKSTRSSLQQPIRNCPLPVIVVRATTK